MALSCFLPFSHHGVHCCKLFHMACRAVIVRSSLIAIPILSILCEVPSFHEPLVMSSHMDKLHCHRDSLELLSSGLTQSMEVAVGFNVRCTAYFKPNILEIVCTKD